VVLLDCCNGNGSRNCERAGEAFRGARRRAHDIALLKLDIAKLHARVAALDTQVAGMHWRLDIGRARR